MTISAASSYSNPFRLIADGQTRTTARNTPSASAAAKAPKANATANFADALPSATPAPKAFEMKSQDNSTGAMAARVATYHAAVAAKAKTDPKIAFVEQLKDKYMDVKGAATKDAIRGDGVVVKAAETNAQARNYFVAYSTARLDNIISGLKYVNDGGSHPDAVLKEAATELEKLISYSNTNHSSAELEKLTTEYTQFKTGSAITLDELRQSLGVNA